MSTGLWTESCDSKKEWRGQFRTAVEYGNTKIVSKTKEGMVQLSIGKKGGERGHAKAKKRMGKSGATI